MTINISGFDKAKKRAAIVQALTEGVKIENTLGTNEVADPMEGDEHLKQFNKGASFMNKLDDNTIIF